MGVNRMDDLISRQAAIDAADRADYTGLAIEDVKKVTDEVVKELKQLPPVQPEIIRCKDCKWYELPSHKIYENCVRWMKRNGILLPIKPDDFCSRAERREDEQ